MYDYRLLYSLERMFTKLRAQEYGRNLSLDIAISRLDR